MSEIDMKYKKYCERCSEMKPLSESCKGRNYCKKCVNTTEYKKEYMQKFGKKRTKENKVLSAILREREKGIDIKDSFITNVVCDETVEEKTKTCTDCNKSFPESLCIKGKNLCKICKKDRNKKYREENREKLIADKRKQRIKIAELKKEMKESDPKEERLKNLKKELKEANHVVEKLPNDIKKCSDCNNIKPITDFRAKGKYNDIQKYQPMCIVCHKIREKTYFSKINKERASELNRIYKIANRERYRQYLIDNPDKRLLKKCRDRVRSILGSGKENPELIGCSAKFLHKWFQFQLDMSHDMTFDNYGSYWHIDHVIPCNKWNINDDAQKRACFHWTNLAPLQASKNMSKHDKIDKVQILQQNLRIKILGKILNQKFTELLLIVAKNSIVREVPKASTTVS